MRKLKINQQGNIQRYFHMIAIILLIALISLQAGAKEKSLVNLAHLDKLYQEIKINGKEIGIIHIYCEYPDYKVVEASGEGITCIDDCARAALVYMNDYKLTGNATSLEKVKKLTRMVLLLQSENGFFYNFLYKDFSINKTGQTSIDQPNWWSWRAIWELAEALVVFNKTDKPFAAEIKPVLHRSIDSTIKWLNADKTFKMINGFRMPSNLPYESAADQAAIIIKALVKFNEVQPDVKTLSIINNLAGAIVQMQAGDKNEFPYYAILSWQTSWHAWGSNQSEALIYAYKLTGNKEYLKTAEKELCYFYPYLIKEKQFSEFEIEKKNSKIITKRKVKYSQIAYGISPMVLACTEAYKVTRKAKYLNTAREFRKWFFGSNEPNQVMYDVLSGRGYDGINDKKTINKNSGAESTIEALLALQALELVRK